MLTEEQNQNDIVKSIRTRESNLPRIMSLLNLYLVNTGNPEHYSLVANHYSLFTEAALYQWFEERYAKVNNKFPNEDIWATPFVSKQEMLAALSDDFVCDTLSEYVAYDHDWFEEVGCSEILSEVSTLLGVRWAAYEEYFFDALKESAPFFSFREQRLKEILEAPITKATYIGGQSN